MGPGMVMSMNMAKGAAVAKAMATGQVMVKATGTRARGSAAEVNRDIMVRVATARATACTMEKADAVRMTRKTERLAGVIGIIMSVTAQAVLRRDGGIILPVGVRADVGKQPIQVPVVTVAMEKVRIMAMVKVDTADAAVTAKVVDIVGIIMDPVAGAAAVVAAAGVGKGQVASSPVAES